MLSSSKRFFSITFIYAIICINMLFGITDADRKKEQQRQADIYQQQLEEDRLNEQRRLEDIRQQQIDEDRLKEQRRLDDLRQQRIDEDRRRERNRSR